MSDDAWLRKFIAALFRLVPEDDPENRDRATLAELRRGLDRPFGEAHHRDGWVLRNVPNALSDEEMDAACLIASLFALHPARLPEGDRDRNLGWSLRQVRDKQPGGEEDGQGPVSRRFTHLADSNATDLPDRLRHIVTLLRSRDETPIDWLQLLRDVLAWDYQGHPVQRNWSRAFWGRRMAEDAGTPAPAATPNTP
jgi:CRISPR type I-E-associated protein CasB/Cse2